MNEYDNTFDKKLNDINYKRTVRKLHDAGWKNCYFTSTDVQMFGYGCGLSPYPQYYDQELDRYQVLPRPYRGYFEIVPG